MMAAGLVARNAVARGLRPAPWVKLHDRPVKELRRVYDDFKPTVDFYEARARNPRMTMNAREFADLLDLRRKEQA